MKQSYQFLPNRKLYCATAITGLIVITTYYVRHPWSRSSIDRLDEHDSLDSPWNRLFHNEANTSTTKLSMKFQPEREMFKTRFFITSLPNHGAGVGHQFDEWIQGLWAAYQFNMTYVFTPFLQVSKHWNKFLYFHLNEIVEKDIVEHFKKIHVEEYLKENSSNLSVRNWIINKQKEFSDQYSTDYALLLRLHRSSSFVSVKQAACFGPINVQLRMKYCAARVIDPVLVNLYEKDRLANRLIVAIHLRCGDSCYDPYRTTSLISIENTILHIHAVLRKYNPKIDAVFHLFSQPPTNDTAEQYFHTLIYSKKFKSVKPYPIKIVPHFALSAPITLHHLIMADVLLTAQSGFSLLAAIFRIGVTFGPATSCQAQLAVSDYDKENGNFSWSQLTYALHYSETVKSLRHLANNFNPHSPGDCLVYEENKHLW